MPDKRMEAAAGQSTCHGFELRMMQGIKSIEERLPG
jgi:hypothetical protein